MVQSKTSTRQTSKTKNSKPTPSKPAAKPQKPYVKISLITTLSLLVIFFITLLVSSLVKTSLIDQSIAETKDAVYLNTGASVQKFYPDEFKSEIFQVPTSLPQPFSDGTIRKHGGSIVGYSTRFQLDTPVQAISKSAVSDFLIADPNELSDSEFPIAIPSDLSIYQPELDYLKELTSGTTLTVVAVVPYLDGVYLVDTGTNKISNLLNQIASSADLNPSVPLNVTKAIIAKLDNYHSVQQYLKDIHRDPTTINSSIGNTFNIIRDFATFSNFFWAISGILLFVSLVFIYICLVLDQRQNSRK